MNEIRCGNHPDRLAVRPCGRCGKPLCGECLDDRYGVCAHHCLRPEPRAGSTIWKVIVTILAIIGGLTVLLLSICAGILFFHS